MSRTVSRRGTRNEWNTTMWLLGPQKKQHKRPTTQGPEDKLVHIHESEERRHAEGKTHEKGDSTERPQHRKVETWSDGGYRKTHLGAQQQHAILTINVGGSREALILAMETDTDILLVQEPPKDTGACHGKRVASSFGVQLER